MSERAPELRAPDAAGAPELAHPSRSRATLLQSQRATPAAAPVATPTPAAAAAHQPCNRRPSTTPRPGAVTVLPVPGLPEFRPGDDLAGALAAAAPWLADGDVVVVTSKVFSKVEGRLVAAPTDPEERDRLRRELVDAETERVIARRGRTLIVAGKLGIVQAAAGVDGSNVAARRARPAPRRPRRQRRPAARRPARAAGRGRRRRRHRHDGPLVADRADRRRDRRRGRRR